MHLPKIAIFLAIGLFGANARVLKCQKISRVLQKPACGCEVLDLSRLESGRLGTYYSSPCGCNGPCGCNNQCSGTGPCGCNPCTCNGPNVYASPCGCNGPCGCNNQCSGTGPCGCNPCTCNGPNVYSSRCGCNVPCGCNRLLDGSIDSWGIANPEVSRTVIKLPTKLASIDAGIIPVGLRSQCDVPNCLCQNIQILEPCKRPNFELLEDIASRIIQGPLQSLAYMEGANLQSVVNSCGCQPTLDCGCNREQCGCQTIQLLDNPCVCQLSAFDVASQLSGYQSGLDCACQSQPNPGSQICQLPAISGYQLPVPSVSYAYMLPAIESPCSYQPTLDVSCACQLPDYGCQMPGCGCQLPDCGCQTVQPPAVVGCGKCRRRITLPPPFL